MSHKGVQLSAVELNASISPELHLAHRLADAADAISLGRYLALDLVVETKPDATPVTDADRAVEKSIRSILEKEAPNDLIIGEEFGGKDLLETAGTGTKFWIIDPIDGTKNFLRGVPTWATLIAHGRIAANGSKIIERGVVSAPALGRRWWAESGAGAYVTESFAPASPLLASPLLASPLLASPLPASLQDGSDSSDQSRTVTRKIAVSKVGSLKDASLSYSDLIGWDQRKSAFATLLDEVWRTRALGDFLSHMLVAEGAVDIAVEPSLALWDMAALAVIVEEAGGRFSSLHGVDGPFGDSGVTTNGLLHEDVIKWLSPESQSGISIRDQVSSDD